MVMTETYTDDRTRQLAMMETYDQTFGIYDHDAHLKDDPLSIIGMHPAEDAITGGPIEILMRELIAHGIPERTGTPLLQLMNFPRYYLDVLLKDGRKAHQVEQDNINQLNLDLDG